MGVPTIVLRRGAAEIRRRSAQMLVVAIVGQSARSQVPCAGVEHGPLTTRHGRRQCNAIPVLVSIPSSAAAIVASSPRRARLLRFVIPWRVANHSLNAQTHPRQGIHVLAIDGHETPEVLHWLATERKPIPY